MTERDGVQGVSTASLAEWERTEAAILRVKSALDSVSRAYGEVNAAFGELDGQLKKMSESAGGYAEETKSAVSAQVDLFGAMGDVFYFLTQTEEEYILANARFMSNWNDTIKQRREQFTSLIGIQEVYQASVDSLSAVHTSAYRAMGDEMLRFIETGEFSVSAMGKVVAQQVKVELVGLSARAAVWAIYETAMGLKDLALGLPTAGLHFASAGKFAAVSAAALVGAAGAQQMLESVGAGGSSTSGSSTGSSTDIVPMASTQENVPVQQVTVNIYNPLSDENWQRIVEEDIIPALNDASERNVSVRLNVVG